MNKRVKSLERVGGASPSVNFLVISPLETCSSHLIFVMQAWLFETAEPPWFGNGG